MAHAGFSFDGHDTPNRLSSCTKRERPVFWAEGKLHLVNQPALPEVFEVVTVSTVAGIVDAIKIMTVRGAPAIGAAGAYGMFCGARECTATSG
jgi:methylthioribose-1-phosphate isomerase